MIARIIAATVAFVAFASAAITLTRTNLSGTEAERIERGRDLVWSIGCNDCHTPKKMGPRGPELDESRLLSGHRESPELPAPPTLPPGPWGIVTSMELTAWSGPWGTTYAFNLTPDENT
jgi:hypothetical protein